LSPFIGTYKFAALCYYIGSIALHSIKEPMKLQRYVSIFALVVGVPTLVMAHDDQHFSSVPTPTTKVQVCMNSGSGEIRVVAAATQCRRNEASFAWNLVGPMGPAGPAGSVGAIGAMGPIGPRGMQGIPGADGAPGAIGATGLTGPQGLNGFDGAQGPAGAAGPRGETGAMGPIGFTGDRGADGAVGPAGANGVNGSDGAVGPAGAVGAKGDTGAQGMQGIPGPAGGEPPEPELLAKGTFDGPGVGGDSDPGGTIGGSIAMEIRDTQHHYLIGGGRNGIFVARSFGNVLSHHRDGSLAFGSVSIDVPQQVGSLLLQQASANGTVLFSIVLKVSTLEMTLTSPSIVAMELGKTTFDANGHAQIAVDTLQLDFRSIDIRNTQGTSISWNLDTNSGHTFTPITLNMSAPSRLLGTNASDADDFVFGRISAGVSGDVTVNRTWDKYSIDHASAFLRQVTYSNLVLTDVELATATTTRTRVSRTLHNAKVKSLTFAGSEETMVLSAESVTVDVPHYAADGTLTSTETVSYP
jgi:hypothetical protein